MSMLAAFAPLMVLLALGALPVAYLACNRKRDSQQSISLADMSFRSGRGAATFGFAEGGGRVAGIYELFGTDRNPARADYTMFEPILNRVATSQGKTLTFFDDIAIAPGRYADTLVCAGDLFIAGNCVFLGSVKVGGDLVVAGNAAFLKTLTVAGHSRIEGVAVVASGMIAKGEVSIEGTLRIGERSREGWLSASNVTGDGQLFLNGHVDSIGPGNATREAGPVQNSSIVAIIIAVLACIMVNPISAYAMQHIAGIACVPDLLTLTCDYPVYAGGPGLSYVFLGLAAAAAMIASRTWLRASLGYLFVMTMAMLMAATMLYDVVVARPIMQEARIINDTMNVLGGAILASLMLTFLIVRRARMKLSQVLIAVGASFGAKIMALVMFGLMRGTVMGATELLMLFLIYTFGAFGLHLMVLCNSLRHLDLSPGRAMVAQPVKAGDKRTGTVDGLRGIAITLVVIYHYIPTHFFSFSLGKPINSILFVVAGFFFAALLLKHRAALDAPFSVRITTLRNMLISRHARIWPMLAVVVGLYLGLSVVDHGELTQQIRSTWPYYLTYLGYLPRWAYEAQAFPSHLWVVSAQETLIFALCAVLAMVGLKTARRGLWLLVAIGIASRLIGTAMLMPVHTSMALESPLAVLDPIALGMIVRFGLDRTSMRSRLRRRLALGLIVTAVAWVLLPNWDMTYFTLAPLISALGAALVMTLSADEVRGRQIAAAGLSSPWLVFLGRISFSLFLIHPFVNTVLRLSFTAVSGVEMPWWALFVVGPAVSIALATVMARHIELPLRKLATRRHRPRTVNTPGVARVLSPQFSGTRSVAHAV